MEECLRIKGGKEAFKFKGRELRISRAIEPKRREKKQRRKEERKQERLQKRLAKAQGPGEESDVEKLLPRNFEDAYQSEDSDDDLSRMPIHKIAANTAFGRVKTEVEKCEQSELSLQNTIALAKEKKKKLLKEMMSSGNSLAKETKLQMSTEQKDLYAKGRHETFNKILKAKIAKRRESNLKKINKIKIKTKKI